MWRPDAAAIRAARSFDMKAAYLTGHGRNEVVTVGERAHPARRAGEVRMRMRAATVDPNTRGRGAGITHELPRIMGLDGALVVEELDGDESRRNAIDIGGRASVAFGG